LFLFFVINTNGQLRLLEFNETYRQWVTQEEVEKMASQAGKINNFMDITDFPRLGDNPNQIFPTIPSQPTHQSQVIPLLAKLSQAQLRTTIQTLSGYSTRYYTSNTGLQAVQYLERQYNSYANGRGDIEVELFQHSWLQPSIIARILGTGPQANQLVILGGHVDSTSSSGAAPGADDDASGSSTVLEIFRVLAGDPTFKPQRTLEFHGYAAEEVGLRGSQAIAQQYLNEGKVVAAMLQLDMTGYHPAGSTAIGVVTDFTNPALSQFVRLLADAYTNTDWRNTACGYGCSDHASWTRAGYPAAFPFEGLFSNSNPNIHTSRDLLAILDLNHALEFAKLGLGFAVELSYAE